MAMELLASLSEDQATRLAYSQRQDMMITYHTLVRESEEYHKNIEELKSRAEESDRRAEEYKHSTEEYKRSTEEYKHSTINAVKAMQAINWSIKDIAKALGLSEKEVMSLL